MPTARPLSLPLRSRADQAALADEAVRPLWRRALLLTAQPEAAADAVLAVAARLGQQIVGGRETVTLGRLLVMVRTHVVAGALPGRSRRRRRRSPGVPPSVVPCLPGTDPVTFLAAQSPAVRGALVLRFDERLLPADLAAVLGLPDPTVGPLLAAAATAWGVACPPPVPPLAQLSRLAVAEPPWELAARFRSALLDAVEPAYVTEVVWLS